MRARRLIAVAAFAAAAIAVCAYVAIHQVGDNIPLRIPSVAKACVFSFYDVQDNDYVGKACQGRDDLIPFAFINPNSLSRITIFPEF